VPACFSANGFHQTGMADIVRQSGLSHGAVYLYSRICWRRLSRCRSLIFGMFSSVQITDEVIVLKRAHLV
jgi:hypothetical protein